MAVSTFSIQATEKGRLLSCPFCGNLPSLKMRIIENQVSRRIECACGIKTQWEEDSKFDGVRRDNDYRNGIQPPYGALYPLPWEENLLAIWNRRVACQ